MKIAYVITRSDVIGGASAHLLDLAEGVASLGHDVVIFVGGAGVVSKKSEERGIKCISINSLVRSINPVKDIRCFFELRAQLKKYKPDLVHLHSSKAGIVGRLVAKTLALPSVFTAHGWAFTEGVSKSKRRLYLMIERVMARLSDKIITVSDYDRILALASGVGSEKILKTIHNGIPSVKCGPAESRLCNRVRLIMVARFEEPKDHALLVKALSLLDNRNWILELVGDGPSQQDVIDQVECLGLSGNVVFSGSRSDVASRLRNSDIFVLISKWEGFPITILEGMRAGLPIIASEVGGIPEAVIEGKTGYLVPKGDAIVLAKSIEELVRSKEARETLGSAGKRYYESNFNFESMLAETVAIYKLIMKQGL